MTNTLTVIHDEPIPYARCPSCDSRLDLPSLVGTHWTVRSPRDIADRLMVEMAALEREELRVVILNTKNVVIRAHTAYVGNISASLVRVGELFRDAVRLDAAGIILVHNLNERVWYRISDSNR